MPEGALATPIPLASTDSVTDSGAPNDSSDAPSEAGRDIASRLNQMRSRQAGGSKRPSRAKGAKAAAAAAAAAAASAAVTPPVEETVPTAPERAAEPTEELAPEPTAEPTPEPTADLAEEPTEELAPEVIAESAPVAETDAAPMAETNAAPVPAVRKKPKGERRVEVRMSGSRADNKERQVRREFVMALVAAVAVFGVIWVATGALGR
jgi:outer membrane biosynthesis protein TonB